MSEPLPKCFENYAALCRHGVIRAAMSTDGFSKREIHKFLKDSIDAGYEVRGATTDDVRSKLGRCAECAAVERGKNADTKN